MTIDDLLRALKSLTPHRVGSADDGGGYMYDYADPDVNGEWIRRDDLQAVIQRFSESAGTASETSGDSPARDL